MREATVVAAAGSVVEVTGCKLVTVSTVLFVATDSELAVGLFKFGCKLVSVVKEFEFRISSIPEVVVTCVVGIQKFVKKYEKF